MFSKVKKWLRRHPRQARPLSAQTSRVRLEVETLEARVVPALVTGAELLDNGGFEATDLAGEQGNLLGWQTFDQSDSHGRWSTYTGDTSPLSLTDVSAPPGGDFAAMLDQDHLFAPGDFSSFPQNQDYEGTHILYQDVFIPANTTAASLSLQLYYLNNGDDFTNTDNNPPLTFVTGPDEVSHQIRIDIMNPNANILDVGTGVLLNVFKTDDSTAEQDEQDYMNVVANLLGFVGQTVRLRIAVTNDRGQLLVGIDDASILATYDDDPIAAPNPDPNFAPIITGLRLRNPGFQNATTDPTLIGRVTDNNRTGLEGSPNNINGLAFSYNDDDFDDLEDIILQRVDSSLVLDAEGNFSVTIPDLDPGTYTVNVRATDSVGNEFTTSILFEVQGISRDVWQAIGPDPFFTDDLTYADQDDNIVSGRVTAIAVDPSDRSGNTYYIGSANGGIWKTTDGGANWAPLTDFFGVGDPDVPASIGALAVANTTGDPDDTVIYAATGVADNAFTSRPGVGILKSTDGGQTWVQVGEADLGGARITKIVVNPTNANIVYVAVAQGGSDGPGVYKSTNGGGSWTNVLTTANMIHNGSLVSVTNPNLLLPSVTDLVLDRFDTQRLIVGLGNIGLVADSMLGGVWESGNGGGNWNSLTGGQSDLNIPNSTIPSGVNVNVGRVTVAIGQGRDGDQDVIYVLIGSNPGALVPGSFDTGTINAGGATTTGLYKSKDGGLTFTHVKLRENDNLTGGGHPAIQLGGSEASDVGALVVDPANPAIVYVGGSTRFLSGLPTYGAIRVDTRNMRDTTYIAPQTVHATSGIKNDGDDITQALQAFNNAGAVRWEDSSSYIGNEAGVDWYDLASNNFREASSDNFLSPGVHALVFDSLGRLLIGTEGGIFRGIGRGFERSTDTPLPPGMEFSNLNGNLQIADLNSIAIDPTTPDVYFAALANLGFAVSDGVLSWVTIDSTGPNHPVLGNLGVPHGSFIRTASLDPFPNDPSNDLVTVVYRTWDYIDFSALFPERSEADGQPGTFEAILSGIGTSDAGPFLPVLAISPNQIEDEDGILRDELLFGTDRVYRTRSSGDDWTALSPILSTLPGALPNGVITALAIPSSTSGVYYAGNDLGEVFATFNDGVDWEKLSNGLPVDAKVNAITVDPENHEVAYVMLNGSGEAQVYKTTDGGQNWTQLVTGLPSAPAYSMVIDKRPVQGGPNGRLFVGTQVGVFVSLNEGLTWTRLGEGIPNVAVVDLAFNQEFEVLIAGTQGRSSFVLSTDEFGPFVDFSVATDPENDFLNQIDVTFNEPIKPESFTIEANEAARAQLVNSITSKNRFRNLLIKDVYQQYLGKAPTSDQLTAGRTILKNSGLEGLIAKVVGGSAYFKRATETLDTSEDPNDNKPGNEHEQREWFRQFVMDATGRSATTDEENAAIAALAAGQTRAQVAQDTLTEGQTAIDFRTRLINDAFVDYLERPATPNEISEQLEDFNFFRMVNNVVGSLDFYMDDDGFFPADPLLVDRTFLKNAYMELNGKLPENKVLKAQEAALGDLVQVRLILPPDGSGRIHNTTPLAITALDSENTSFQLDFANFVGSNFTLVLGPNTLNNNIVDQVGNPMNQDGDEVNGEFPQDRYTGTYPPNLDDPPNPTSSAQFASIASADMSEQESATPKSQSQSSTSDTTFTAQSDSSDGNTDVVRSLQADSGSRTQALTELFTRMSNRGPSPSELFSFFGQLATRSSAGALGGIAESFWGHGRTVDSWDESLIQDLIAGLEDDLKKPLR